MRMLKWPNILFAVVLTAVPATRAQEMAELFEDSFIHEVRLTTADPAGWQTLREKYLESDYYQAAFEWRGRRLEGVGIRSRGNGSRNSAKPGLKVDFGRFNSGETFLGLKSIVLDNHVQDPSTLKERLALRLFRKMGIVAPRTAHARLYVNGEYSGLYSIVESVDKGFLKRNYDEDTGYLYDYEWTLDFRFQFLGDDPELYSPAPFEPQTNEKNPDPQPIVDMVRTINDSSDEEFVEAVSKYIDLKAFLTYLATEVYLGEADGILGDWGINNFYLYRYRDSTLSTFIPWDRDLSFERSQTIWHNVDTNVLTRRAFAVPELREHFLAELLRCAEIAGGPDGWLAKQVDALQEQVRESVANDVNTPFTYANFEEGIWLLREFAFVRSDAVVREVMENRERDRNPY